MVNLSTPTGVSRSIHNSYRRGEREIEQKQRDLISRTIGIIGLGTIGTHIAEILRFGFGATVNYYSRTRKQDEEARLGIGYLPLRELATQSDALIVMTPGNDTTYGFVDTDMVSLLPNGTLLVNTARPAIVTSRALEQGLADGKISVAVYDGFYDGPEAATLLQKFGEDRLLVTGHIASLTSDARDGMSKMAVQSILNVTVNGTDEHFIP